MAFESFDDEYFSDKPKKETGLLLTDPLKAVARGVMGGLPDALLSGAQTALGGYAKIGDLLAGNENAGQGGDIENAVNSGVGLLRDNTTRRLKAGIEEALPYSAGTQQAQAELGQEIANIQAQKDTGFVQRGVESMGAALANPRASLPSLIESVPQFVVGAAGLKAAKVAEGIAGVGTAENLLADAATATAAGNVAKAAELTKLAGKAAAGQNMAIMGLGNAALEGASNADGAIEDVKNAPIEQLRLNP